MLQVRFSGYESPSMMRAAIHALNAYAAAAEAAQAELNRAPAPFMAEVQSGDNSAEYGSDPRQIALPLAATPVEVVEAAPAEAEKPKRTRRTKQEIAEAAAADAAAETPADQTGDQSAVIAAAQELKAAQVNVKMEAEPAQEVRLEDIRAVAAKFNTDALREIALAILNKHAAASVSALHNRDNIIRVSVLRDFEAAFATYEKEQA